MKLLITMSILAIGLQFAPVALAQEPSGSAGSPARGFGRQLANLSPEEREKLRAAHQAAMQDPGLTAAREKVKQAQREFREAVRASMLKADPSVKAILDKLPKGGEHEEN
jgi:hypothetical protein